MRDIGLSPGVEIVAADYFMSVVQKPFAEMGTEKTSPAGNENPFIRIIFHLKNIGTIKKPIMRATIAVMITSQCLDQ